VNEEAGPPPPPALPPHLARRDEDAALWLRTINLMRKNPRITLLPLAVTQAPFALVTASVFFYLFYSAYPEAKFDTLNWLGDAPGGLRLTMALLGAAQSLFSLVGAAGTMVSVEALTKGKPLGLAQSLDPAFTRMGGLLVFAVVFNLLLLVTFIGLIVFVYFIARWGLAIQAYVLDGRSILSAFGLSWRLMRGRIMAFLALLLTAIPLALLLLISTSLVFGLLASPFGTDPGRTTELVFQSIALFIVILTFIPVAAYLATSTTLFYFSAREESDD